MSASAATENDSRLVFRFEIWNVRSNSHNPAPETKSPITHQCTVLDHHGIDAASEGRPPTHAKKPAPMKNAAAASSKRPMICLTSSLAGPVRGILSTHPGFALRRRYGAPIPMPSAAKIVRISTGGIVAAPASSAPATNPKHGSPSTAVITPNRNEPQALSALGLTMYAFCGSWIVNSPMMPTPMNRDQQPDPECEPPDPEEPRRVGYRRQERDRQPDREPKRDHPEEHPEPERQALARRARVLADRHDLDRDDRQYARREVQHESAERREQADHDHCR